MTDHAYPMQVILVGLVVVAVLACTKPPEPPQYTTIDEAIARGDLADVKLHVVADPEAVNTGQRPNMTPLHMAIMRKQVDISRYLIESGADVDALDSGERTPLHLCVDRDLPEIATALLAKGARPDEWDKAGWTPLHHAGAKNRFAVGKALVAGGANPSALSVRGGTPLHEAAASAGGELVQFLLDQGVDPATYADDGSTAWSVAQTSGNQAALEVLKDAGADYQSTKWTSLFDGETLEGWTQRDGKARYEVREGAIVGISARGTPNSFLCSNGLFGDFELRFEVKCGPINSGVQIRSQEHVTDQQGNIKKERVNGPQVEIEHSPGQAGFIYGEGYSKWRSPEPQSHNPAVKQHHHFKNDEWNHYRIVAQGPRIQTWINGAPVADLNDPESYETYSKGFIGLQVHSHKVADVEIHWRNIQIRRLLLDTANPDPS
ncbi:MAG: family 16 glycoside hydrolase [Verrucomicrobiota bacterium]